MMTNISTHVTAMDCIVREARNFANCVHKAVQASPISQRGAAEPQQAALLPHLSQAKSATFCTMSQLWIPASQGSVLHMLASFRHCCWLALVLLLLCFKADPGAFLKRIFIWHCEVPECAKLTFSCSIHSGTSSASLPVYVGEEEQPYLLPWKLWYVFSLRQREKV